MIGLLAALAVKAAVTQVTVYGDRARVVRAGEVAVQGTARAELPLLPDSVDTSSIRVEASGAEVRKVDIEHVEPDEFPAGEARELLAKLEALDDQGARLVDERGQVEKHLAALAKIAPAVPEEPLRPRPKLNPRSWAEALAFAQDEEQALRARLRDSELRVLELGRQREPIAERARIIGGAVRRSGWRVTAELAGEGAARLTLTYVAVRARWTPAYDLQLLADQKTLRVSFSGAAAQESGEDWEDAAFTLSTAVPATVRALPEIATWKIGERERFIPTPRREDRPPPPAPPQPPPVRPLESANDQLRGELLARAGGQAESKEALMETRAAPAEAPSVASPRVARKALAPPPPKAAAPVEQPMTRALGVAARNLREEPQEQVGIAPPPSWRPPPLPSNSPAALAGGYDLEFPSLRRETLHSGGGARRVLLFSETWPVQTSRVIYPALSPDAYLVAKGRNPSRRTLPGGEASLSVGADLAGTAELQIVSPGAEFTLPLGIDRAIKSFRNVAQVQTEKGIFSKDEVTRYAVTIEVANPYPAKVPLQIFDQLPLPGDKNVEISLVDGQGAERDEKTGKLTWRLTAPPSGTVKIAFVYDLKRPKGFKVHQ
jgi:hypothetical protein